MYLKAIFICVVILAIARADEKTKCDRAPKHYEELGCTGVFDDGGDCPTRFDCPKFDELDSNHCYYKGISYARGEELKDTLLAVCLPNCVCGKYGDPASFSCGMYGCPEHTNPMYRKCVHQKTFSDCCAKNIICEKEEIEKLPTCSFENRTYRLGEAIYPKDFPCHKCICGENFDSTTVEGNPQCQIINCGIEITNFNNIRKGCVPVYFEKRCCPISYRCPSEKDQVVAWDEGKTSTDELGEICKFGSLTLRIGDTVNNSDKCVECKCDTPPMIHCVQKKEC